MGNRLIDSYLTAEQAAEHLDLHPVTVMRFCREKRIRHRKVGQRYFFTLEDLKAFVEGSAVQPKPAKSKAAPVKTRHIKAR